MRYLVIAAVLALAGCETAEDEPSMCAPRSGLYEGAATTTSGNCGAFPKIVLKAEEIDGPAAGCTVVQKTVTPNGCQVLIELDCLVDGVTTHVRRHIKWSADGNTGRGSIVADVRGPNGTCSGSYDISYRRP